MSEQTNRTWPCPACGTMFDMDREEGYEEFTVGHIRVPGRKVVHHIICPSCGRCMACADKGNTHD